MISIELVYSIQEQFIDGLVFQRHDESIYFSILSREDCDWLLRTTQLVIKRVEKSLFSAGCEERGGELHLLRMSVNKIKDDNASQFKEDLTNVDS